MAVDNGDGFKFWHSYYEALELMSDEDAGHFVKSLCAYVFDGTEPTFSNSLERFGFTLIADQAVESKRLTAQAKARGVKSGAARRKKKDSKASPKAFPKSVPNVSRYVSSSFQEEEEGAADAGPKGPPPPLPRFGGGER